MAILPSNPRDQKLAFVALLAVVLAGLYWNFVYSPKSAELATIRVHVDSLEAMNARAKIEMSKGTANELRQQAEESKANLRAMRRLVPVSNEVPALLEQVSTAARRVGLDIGSVTPQPVITGDAFDTYRYKVGVIGSYHRIGEFLTNVASLPRIIAPINMNLVPFTAQATAARSRLRRGEALLRLEFEMQTYVAKSGSPDEARFPSEVDR